MTSALLVILLGLLVYGFSATETSLTRYPEVFGPNSFRCPVCFDKSAVNSSLSFFDALNRPLIEFEDYWPSCTGTRSLPEQYFYDPIACLRISFYKIVEKKLIPTYGYIQIPFTYFKRILGGTFSIRKKFSIRSGDVVMSGQFCDEETHCFVDSNKFITYPPQPTTEIATSTTIPIMTSTYLSTSSKDLEILHEMTTSTHSSTSPDGSKDAVTDMTTTMSNDGLSATTLESITRGNLMTSASTMSFTDDRISTYKVSTAIEMTTVYVATSGPTTTDPSTSAVLFDDPTTIRATTSSDIEDSTQIILNHDGQHKLTEATQPDSTLAPTSTMPNFVTTPVADTTHAEYYIMDIFLCLLGVAVCIIIIFVIIKTIQKINKNCNDASPEDRHRLAKEQPSALARFPQYVESSSSNLGETIHPSIGLSFGNDLPPYRIKDRNPIAIFRDKRDRKFKSHVHSILERSPKDYAFLDSRRPINTADLPYIDDVLIDE